MPNVLVTLYVIVVISFYNLSDELIRQITINCAERGLLVRLFPFYSDENKNLFIVQLLRVRDEIRVTIACYQTLYEVKQQVIT